MTCAEILKGRVAVRAVYYEILRQSAVVCRGLVGSAQCVINILSFDTTLDLILRCPTVLVSNAGATLPSVLVTYLSRCHT